ncbi:MAG: exodeoxyribonuclease VII small subunit [Clostridia bacterium]|nr:exodeoxyribonuclease VII small subunit [Clostridia bacterium]
MARKKSFEEALSRLEEIAEEMEKGETGLENSVKLYKEGVELSVYCSDILNKAEQQVSELKESADGVFSKRNFNMGEE